MKKQYIALITFVFALVSLLNSENANAQISVGGGTNESQALPIEAYYGYTFSQSIYLQPSINSSGNITTLAWYFSGTSNLSNTQDIIVWMGHTAKTSFSSSTDWIDTTTLTRVYTGNLGTPTGPGWITITLDNSFNYNNTDNLVIAVDENTPSYNSSGDDFYNTASAGTQSIWYRSDGTNPDPGAPPTATGTAAYIPNVTLGGLVAALPPNCDATPSSPASGGTNVLETTSIDWNPATGSPSGYKLQIGTTTGGSQILAQTNVGAVTSYQPSTSLAYNTTYYVTITPYNANGDATGCTEYSFTTRMDPSVMAPWSDDFESHSTTTNSTFSTNNWISNPAGTTSLFRWNIDGSGSTPSSSTGPTNGANSGNNYLYTEASSGSANAIAELTSPPINVSSLTTPFLKFMYHMYGATMGDLHIDIHDGSSWTNAVYTISGQQQTSGTDPWLEAGVNLSAYSGGTITIRLRAIKGSSYTGDISIDDISVDEAPACPDPHSLTVNTLTSNSAQLSWTAGGTETSWHLEYGAAGFTQGTGTLLVTGTNPHALTGLSSNTAYDVYLRAICSASDSSQWISSSFRTACSPFTAPYSQSFDGTTEPEVDACWTVINNTAGWLRTDATPIGTSPNSGTNAIEFYNSTGTNPMDMMLVSPQLSDLDNTKRIRFFLHDYSGTSDMIIGTMSDPTNNATFSPLDTLTPADMTYRSWKEHTISFDSYVGSDKYIAFAHGSNTTFDYIQLDDFNYEVIPACQNVSAVTTDSVSATYAAISWTAGGSETKWNVEYGLSGFTQGTGTSALVTSMPYSVSGLSSSTSYDFYVQAICGEGKSATLSPWSNAHTVTTLIQGPVGFSCSVGNATTVFTEEFDAIGSWTGDFGTGTTVRKWNIDAAGTGSSGTGPSAAHSGSNYIYYEASSGTPTQATIVSPAIDLSAALEAAELSFWMHAYGNTMGTFTLGVGTSASGPFTSVFTHNSQIQTTNADPWTNVGVDLTAYVGQTIYLQMDMLHGSDFYGDMAFDLFEISTCASCVSPTNLATTTVTSSSAQFSWTAGGTETEWLTSYGLAGISANAGTQATTTSNPYSVSGLMANTSYDFYVKAICAPGDSSGWVGPVSFTTACDAISSFPYTENFDGSLTNNVWDCWKVINDDNDSYTWSQANTYISPTRSGLYAAHGMGNSNDHLISPQLALPSGVNMRMNVWEIVESSSRNNDYQVLVSTTGNSVADFTDTLASYSATSTTWTERTVDLSAYSGMNIYISFWQTYSGATNYGFGLDDFVIEEIPSCIVPSAAVVSSITDVSAMLSWTENNSATSWEISYGTSGFTAGAGTQVVTGSNPYSLTGLSAQTGYDWYVRSICGSGDTSVWTAGAGFTTLCSSVTLPFNEDFENAGSIPNCWIQSSANAEDWRFGTNGAATYGPTSGMGGSGYYAWLDDSESPHSDFSGMETPLIDLSGSTHPGLEFQLWSEDHQGINSIYMLYIDVNSGSGYTTIDSFDVNNTGWELQRVYLGSYTGQSIQIRFRGEEMSSGYQKDIAIDDVSVTDGFVCDAPENLRAQFLSDTSATLRWNTHSDAIAYKIRWKEAGAPNFGPVHFRHTNTGMYEIDGLTANTKYVYVVTANCKAGYGDASIERFSTIGAPCEIPTNIKTREIHSDMARAQWDAMTGAVKYRLRYRAQGAPNWTNMTISAPRTKKWLTGLSASTTYEYQVKTVCEVGPTASGTRWSSVNTFTTQAGGARIKFDDIEATEEEVSINVYPNPNNGTFNFNLVNNGEVDGTLEVRDIVGKIVHFENIHSENGIITKSINLDIDTKGIYMLKFTNGEFIHNERLIIK